MSANLKKAKAYRTMAVDALGMEPDAVDKMSLPELEGHFQAQAVQSLMEQRKAQAQEREAKARLMMMQQDEAQAWPEFAKRLMGGGAPGAGPGADLMSPGAGAGGVGPTSGTGNTFSPENIMRAMSEMGATSPRLSSALARTLVPQLMQGGTGPQSWKSPEGNPYVFMNHTLMADRPPLDINAMMGTAPEGYGVVQTGPGKAQVVKTRKELPPTFHSALDRAQTDIAGAETTLQQPDSMFTDAKDMAMKKGLAQKRLTTARTAAKGTIDRYHSTGYLTDEQRDMMYGDLGLKPQQQQQTSAKGVAGRKTVQDKNGNKFTVPANQLQAALDQGYTEVK
jgi:hypothetical protein